MSERVNITIPEGVTLDALHLSRDAASGHIRFDWAPIEMICKASGIDVTLLRDQPEDNLAGLLIAWYAEELQRGLPRNAVLDELMAETRVETAIEDQRKKGGWAP